MPLEADIGLVDDVETAQLRQPIRPTKTVSEGRRVAVAVAGLVEREHDITPPGEFDGKAVLGLAGVDVAVNREDPGCGGLRRGIGRNVEQGAHGVALGSLEPDILDADAARGLGEMRQQAAGQNQDQPGNRQRPSAAHQNLPDIPSR
jgi:hypothetical protein